MARLRKEWLDFKKRHPVFEKNKDFKADVGPKMDAYEAAVDACAPAIDTLFKALLNTKVKGDALQAALEKYDSLVKKLQREDADIKKDFNIVLSVASHLSNSYALGAESAFGTAVKKYGVAFNNVSKT